MIRAAQLGLLLAAAVLWVATRMRWVSVTTFDGLSHPKTSSVTGAAWASALLPLAVLLLAAALAALAVRGAMLRALAVLVALASLLIGYLGVGLLLAPDVGPRGASLAGVAVADLVGSARHTGGAVLTIAAAVLTLVAAAMLMRAAASASAATKYATTPGVADDGAAAATSERQMWDALDEGRDPTDTEGR